MSPVRLKIRKKDGVPKERHNICVECGDSVALQVDFEGNEYVIDGTIENSFFQAEPSWIVPDVNDANMESASEIPPGQYVLIRLNEQGAVFFAEDRK
jgi:hypothetical protein